MNKLVAGLVSLSLLTVAAQSQAQVYARGGLGVGYLTMKDKNDYVSVNGVGGGVDLAIGYMPIETFSIGLAFQFQQAFQPTVSLSGKNAGDLKYNLNSGLLGVAGDFFLPGTGLSFGATIGAQRVTLSDDAGNELTAARGFGFGVRGIYSFVSIDKIHIGGMLQFTSGFISDSGTSSSAESSLGVYTGQLLITASYY